MAAETSRRTLQYYEGNANEFWRGTCCHSVTQNVDALLSAIEGSGPFRILDFGCGPGRDLAEFRRRRYDAVGLDGCASFVKMAREYSGADVWEQDFLELALPGAEFDGIFANASLFHVPSDALPRVLGELRDALKPRGVLFCSNPRGIDEEGWSGDRYGCYFEINRWRQLISTAGFAEIDHYYRPAGLPRYEQPWLAMLWRKLG